MQDKSDSIIDSLPLAERLVTTLMSNYPQASANGALDDRQLCLLAQNQLLNLIKWQKTTTWLAPGAMAAFVAGG